MTKIFFILIKLEMDVFVSVKFFVRFFLFCKIKIIIFYLEQDWIVSIFMIDFFTSVMRMINHTYNRCKKVIHIDSDILILFHVKKMTNFNFTKKKKRFNPKIISSRSFSFCFLSSVFSFASDIFLGLLFF